LLSIINPIVHKISTKISSISIFSIAAASGFRKHEICENSGTGFPLHRLEITQHEIWIKFFVLSVIRGASRPYWTNIFINRVTKSVFRKSSRAFILSPIIFPNAHIHFYFKL